MSDNGCIVIFSSHRMEHVELFCEELLILVRGKSILSGSLKQIKEDYRKKSIHVNGNINVNKIKELKGVEDVEKTPEEYIIRVSDKKYIDDVFNIVKEGKNIVRFNVEDPTLDEIFVSKVGEVYE